jgi:hypothetical protein
VALGIVLSLAGIAGALDITACDTAVPAGEVGVLTVDLDCGPNTVPDSYGVELARNATLDLQGHTITGAQWAVYSPAACCAPRMSPATRAGDSAGTGS